MVNSSTLSSTWTTGGACGLTTQFFQATTGVVGLIKVYPLWVLTPFTSRGNIMGIDHIDIISRDLPIRWSLRINMLRLFSKKYRVGLGWPGNYPLGFSKAIIHSFIFQSWLRLLDHLFQIGQGFDQLFLLSGLGWILVQLETWCEGIIVI